MAGGSKIVDPGADAGDLVEGMVFAMMRGNPIPETRVVSPIAPKCVDLSTA